MTRAAVGLLGTCLLVAAARMLASDETFGAEGPKLTRLAVDRDTAPRAPPAPPGTGSRPTRADPSFIIVTPTYPRDFPKNELFLATLARNCADCHRVPILFVTATPAEADTLTSRLATHPFLSSWLQVSRVSLNGTARGGRSRRPLAGDPVPDPPTQPSIRVHVTSLAGVVGEMGMPVAQTMERYRRNVKWYGKYTLQSTKKFAGAWLAFGRLGADVVWWLDSEAYLWSRGTSVETMLRGQWRHPVMFWTRHTRWYPRSTVNRVCPPRGALGDPEKLFQGPAPHLFESTFYLPGKRVFQSWVGYVERAWGGKRFLDVFLRHGSNESGHTFHFIETQFMVFVKLCQARNHTPACSRYNVVEVDALLQRAMGAADANAYLALTQRKGQFEHLFKFIERPRFRPGILAIVREFTLPTFRLDGSYNTCSLTRAVLDMLSRGVIHTDFQTNSASVAEKFLPDTKCRASLPLECEDRVPGIRWPVCSVVQGNGR